MTEISSYTPGTFCWIDLGTTNAGAAKQFYTALFGWKANDMPMGPDMFYTMFQLEGKDVAALYQQDVEQQAQGIPPHWLSYISVASVDETAEKIKSLGGQVLTHPMDVFEAGRMVPVQDPQGAIFALWQPRQHIGARLLNQPGTLCWNELATTDREGANGFYTGLFDWEAQTADMEGTLYTMFLNQGRATAGMMQMDGSWGNIPPHWMVYFAVDDCDHSVEKVVELGGTVLIQPVMAQGVGRFAVVRDPQGAAFGVIKLENPLSQ